MLSQAHAQLAELRPEIEALGALVQDSGNASGLRHADNTELLEVMHAADKHRAEQLTEHISWLESGMTDLEGTLTSTAQDSGDTARGGQAPR